MAQNKPCEFNEKTLQFVGTPVEQARCLLRPNKIGATICRLLSVAGLTLNVQGLDALDGSPVLDIKPVMTEFLPAPGDVRQPRWSQQLMTKYFAVEKS